MPGILTRHPSPSNVPLILTGESGEPSQFHVRIRFSSPCPTPEQVKDGLDRTPCQPDRLTRYKDCTYNDKVEAIMQDRWFEMKTRKFLDTFVPGTNMKAVQLRGLGDFSVLDLDYNKVDESLIYPALVCDFPFFSSKIFSILVLVPQIQFGVRPYQIKDFVHGRLELARVGSH